MKKSILVNLTGHASFPARATGHMFSHAHLKFPTHSIVLQYIFPVLSTGLYVFSHLTQVYIFEFPALATSHMSYASSSDWFTVLFTAAVTGFAIILTKNSVYWLSLENPSSRDSMTSFHIPYKSQAN